MKTQRLTPDRPAPRRPRCPAWIERAAQHPRAAWTITAACTAASLLLLAVMATGGMGPVTDWNGPPMLKPGIPEPTIAAPPATEAPSTRPTPSGDPSTAPANGPTRPSDRPTSPTGNTPDPRAAGPAAAPHSPTQPAQDDPAPSRSPDTRTDPEPATEPEPENEGQWPACTINGVGTYHHGDPRYSECMKPRLGIGEPDPRPCTSGGVTYQPTHPLWDECLVGET